MNVREPFGYCLSPTLYGLAFQPQGPDRALLTEDGQAVSPSDIYAFGGPRFCPLPRSTRTQVKESIGHSRTASLLRRSRGNSAQMSVDDNDHPTSIAADGVEQTVHWRSSSVNGLSFAGGVGDLYNPWSGFCSPRSTGYRSHTHAADVAGAQISLESHEAWASILPMAKGNIESSRSGPSFDMVNSLKLLSRSIDSIESLGVALSHELQPYRVPSRDFEFITGVRDTSDDFPPTSPFISPIPSINFSRVWDRNLSPLTRQTRGKRCRLTQDNVHCERNSDEQEPGAEGMQFFPMSSKSSCSYASLNGVVHLPSTIFGERKAKRRRLKDNSLPPGLLLTVDKTTSAFDQSVSTLAERLSSISVTNTEQDGRSPSDLPRKYGLKDKFSSSTSPVHLSPVQIIFHQSEPVQLKHLRKRRAAEASRNKHAGEGFFKMKARHRRRALRKANSEPSKPDSRIRQGTPFPQAFLEPLAVTFESEGAYHDWYRCESPEEVSIYDAGGEKQDPAAIIDLPAQRLLFCHDAGGGVRTPFNPCDTEHPVEMCTANVPSTSAH